MLGLFVVCGLFVFYVVWFVVCSCVLLLLCVCVCVGVFCVGVLCVDLFVLVCVGLMWLRVVVCVRV